MTPLLWAKRIQELPPYLFAEIDRIKAELREKGMDIIDLSIGDPDIPTPKIIVEKLREEAGNSSHHQYPSYWGSRRFRKAAARWYEERFGVSVDPNTEVLALIGSKEGIAHAPLAFVNPDDVVLVPNIAYPVYANATSFAGGNTYFFPLDPEQGFTPRLNQIPNNISHKAKLLFLNYPNNPTSAVMALDAFSEVSSWAKEQNILVCHDAAYTEVKFGDFDPPSFLQTKNGKKVCLEFHSLSKTFNMTGWRVAFAVGNKDAISGLAKIKTNVDSGVFTAIQEAGIIALENWKTLRDQNNQIYEKRKQVVTEELQKLSISFQSTQATFYIWCKVPTKETSTDFCARVLKEAGVSFTPGIGFGPGGEGYFRISLTAPEERLQEAISRIKAKL